MLQEFSIQNDSDFPALGGGGAAGGDAAVAGSEADATKEGGAKGDGGKGGEGPAGSPLPGAGPLTPGSGAAAAAMGADRCAVVIYRFNLCCMFRRYNT